MNRYSIKADTYRQYGQFRWRYVITGMFKCRVFRLLILMRLCQAVASIDSPWRLLLLLPLKQLHHWACRSAGIDFSWHTQVGPGIALPHGWGLVVNPKAKIGSNVTLFHGVTLGRRDAIGPNGERKIGYPTLEDEVWIGPHAIVVGGIVIGKGSRIAGGAFVSENIPPYSIVVGNPASIVKSNCVPDVMNPAPITSK